MKSLLILTDFSANANHAAESALMLSEKLQTNIVLFNTYYNRPFIPNYTGGPWATDEFSLRKDESNEKLNELGLCLQEKIAQMANHTYVPEVFYHSSNGPLGKNVINIEDSSHIELVVMGASSNANLNHVFYGSDTLAVIDTSKRPVLVIPENANLDDLAKVTFATDFEDDDMTAIHYVIKLGRLFNFRLEIVHVSLIEDTGGAHPDEMEMEFERKVNRLKYPGITYQYIKGKDVVNRLNKLCRANRSDMLVLMHSQHSLFSNILKKCTADKTQPNHQIPLLIIPARLKGK